MPVQRSPIRTRNFYINSLNKTPPKPTTSDIKNKPKISLSAIKEDSNEPQSSVHTLPLNPPQICFNMAANIYLPLIPNYEKESLDFVIKCDHIYSKMITNDDRALFLTHVLMKFTGPLLQTISNVDPLTWAAVKATLNKNVEKPQNSRDLFSELSKTVQGQSEDINVYGDRIQKVYQKLNAAYLHELQENGEDILVLPDNIKKLNENTCMRAFEDGIRSSNLKMITILEKSETLSESITFAAYQEKRFGSSSASNFQTRPAASFTPTCHRCGVVGHLASRCHERQTVLTCSYCHKVGHLINDCQTRQWRNVKTEVEEKPQENTRQPYQNPFSRPNPARDDRPQQANKPPTPTNRVNFTESEQTSGNEMSREEELNATPRVSNLQ